MESLGSIAACFPFWERVGQPKNIITAKAGSFYNDARWHEKNGIVCDTNYSALDTNITLAEIGTEGTIFADFQQLVQIDSLFQYVFYSRRYDEFAFYRNPGGGDPYYNCRIGTLAAIEMYSNIDMYDGDRHTVAFHWRYEDTTGFYIDGKYQDSRGAETPDSTAETIKINGRDDSESRYSGGPMYSATVFNVVLSDSQIAHLSDNPYFLLNRVAPVFYSIPQTVSFKPFWASQATRISL